MATAYIEINDAGITQAIDGKLIDTSPAFAVLDKEKLILGEEARANARLLPRWTNNRFWHQLSRDPISNATHNIRHHADLAFAHLEAIWAGLAKQGLTKQGIGKQVDEVIIGVPDTYDQIQLGLLLGMANAANIPVVGLVNSALVAIAKVANQNSILHLDISLHRITMTEFQLENELKKINTINVSESGLFTLWDRWANVVAQQFIHSSRFDPMHKAHSEQLLFDLLPNWISQKNPNATFDMEINGVMHSTHIPEDQLIQVCQSIYPKMIRSIASTNCDALYISHRFQGFPGFEAALQSVKGLNIHRLSSTAAIEAVHQHREDITSKAGSVSHITSLPLNSPPPVSSHVKKPTPTHILYRHQARTIGDRVSVSGISDEGILTVEKSDAVFSISKEAGGLILTSFSTEVKLNGQPVDSATMVSIGDQISIGQKNTTLIVAN